MRFGHPTVPYTLDLEFRGVIQGLSILPKPKHKHKPKSASVPSDPQIPLCHYFGGIPYASPPIGAHRFQKPRPLAPCFRYGTHANPGVYVDGTGVCPQPRFDDALVEDDWDEDCLQCNVWVPGGDHERPEKGWPVVFWIHGGFLQFGDPNSETGSLVRLLSETSCKAIFVMPGYRLNVFGFLTSPSICSASKGTSLCANVGFWDQRLALEWTHKNISYFGGDAGNITVGGYSAGSHSAFHQLAYDLGLPAEKSIIRRTMMLSNGPGVQPKSLAEAEEQFDEFLSALKIDRKDLSPDQILEKLQSLSPKQLLQATLHMTHHQFRGITDGSFIRPTLFQELDDGTFARRVRERNIKLLIGECRDEHYVYGTWRSPQNNYTSLRSRLIADYPVAAVDAMLAHYCPNQRLPADKGWKSWKDAFGRIYANIQIHAMERGMVSKLAAHGAGDLVYRYRIEWRASCAHTRPEWGVTHGSDSVIWFYGDGKRLKRGEERIVKEAFLDNLARFWRGGEMQWGTKGPLEIRVLRPDGEVWCGRDEGLDEGVQVWDIIAKATWERDGKKSERMHARL